MKSLVLALAALLMVPVAANAQTRVEDLAEIQRLPVEIDIAVDTKNWAKARKFFTDQIRVDFTSLVGGEPATIPADALISGWSGNLGPKKFSFHMRGRSLVALDGDRATAYSNGYAWNKMEGNGDPLWEVWGNYTYTLVRTGGGWKVDGMTFVMTHERGNMWVRNTPSPKE